MLLLTAPGASPRLVATPVPRLLDRVRHAIRIRHYSPRTEKAYASNGSHDAGFSTSVAQCAGILLDIRRMRCTSFSSRMTRS